MERQVQRKDKGENKLVLTEKGNSPGEGMYGLEGPGEPGEPGVGDQAGE